MKTQSTCYVYFITDSHGHIKIGKAIDTYQRMLTLQTGNPYKLKQLLSVLFYTEEEAYALESALHRKFAFCQLEGEWFEEGPVLDFIDREVVAVDQFKFGGLKFGKFVKTERTLNAYSS